MANADFSSFLNGTLDNPLVGLGAGILSAPRGASFGQQLGHGLSFAGDLRTRALRNEAARGALRDQQAAREAVARRQDANQRLINLLAPEGAATAAAPGAGAPISLLGGFQADPRAHQVASAGGALPAAGAGPAAPLDRRRVLGLLAEIAPERFAGGLLEQLLAPPAAPEKPTNLQREYEFLVGQGVSPEMALESLRKGTVVNVGGEGEKPLSASDLLKYRLPDGSLPPGGATQSEVTAMGGVLMTDQQQKALEAAKQYGPVLDQLERLALGEGGIFSDIEPGVSNRFQAGVDLFIGSLTRENPNIALYDDLVNSTLSPLIKQLGEAGALAEGDVARAQGLLPKMRGEFLLPDTREEAISKFNTVREILARGARNAERGVFPGRTASSRSGAQGETEGGGMDFSALDPTQLLAVDVTGLKGKALQAYEAALDAAGF